MMRWFLLTLILFLANLAEADDTPCVGKKFSTQLREGVFVETEYFPAFDSQAGIVFIQGPEARFQKSRSFIQSLCQRGFSIAAFNVIGPQKTDKDYLRAAKFITSRFDEQTLLAYGWSKGAEVATALAHGQPKKFHRVFLESPVLSPGQKFSHGTRIFACAKDSQTSLKDLKKASKSAKVYVSQASACSELKGPLADFIEADYVGFASDGGFWRKL